MANTFIPVPPQILGGATGYSVSDRGEIRCNNIPVHIFTALQRNENERYKTISIKQKNYYVHRIVYFSFHPEHINKGRVIFRKINAEMLNPDGVLRTHLEDLLFQPFKNAQEEIPDTPPVQASHPHYGAFTYNEWVALHTSDAHELMALDDPHGCIIRRKSDQRILASDTIKDYCKTHLILLSLFPNVPPNETVDHMNNNCKDDNPINLCWMTKSENSSRANEAVQKTRSGHCVEMFIDNVVYGQFPSIEAAARYVHQELEDQEVANLGKPNTIASKIRDVAKGSRKCKAYGFDWRFVGTYTSIYDNETWNEYKLGADQIQVSDYGRVKAKYGITIGTRFRESKYRRIGYNIEKGKRASIYVHKLVWIAFNPDEHISEGAIILHDDNAPLDADGCYINKLESLRIGSKSENMQEYHDTLRDRDLAPKTKVSHRIEQQSLQPPSESASVSRRVINTTCEKIQVDDETCVLKKNANIIICDTRYADELLKSTYDGGRIHYKGKRIPLPTFVWTILNKQDVPENHCVKPVNYVPYDVRIENLMLHKGDPKTLRTPKNLYVPDDLRNKLGFDILPQHVTVSTDRFYYSGELRSFDANLSSVQVTKANFENHVLPVLTAYYQQIHDKDYNEVYAHYCKQVQRYNYIFTQGHRV
jgi:hypothetical protein